MMIECDEKLTATIDELAKKLCISRDEVIRRAVALLKVSAEGVERNERIFLISAESRKEILL